MTASLPPIDLGPELFLNRELSLLDFNRRVLAQARDEQTPLLERLRFMCISTTNLDEFFEIRVAGLKQRIEAGALQSDTDQLGPQETLESIHGEAQTLVADQYAVWNTVMIPALESAGIRFIKRRDWNKTQEAWLKRYFTKEVLPVLSPMGIDPAHPFPKVINKSLNFIVSLEGRDAFGRDSALAVVQAPRSLHRLIQLPPNSRGNGRHDFVFLSSVIHAHVSELFPGMTATGCYQFRVTRNSDLFVDEEEVEDLLRAVEGELNSRRFGDAVRLEVANDCPPELQRYLLDHFELDEGDVYQVDGPVNLNRVAEVYDRVDRPDLKFPPFAPGMPRALLRHASIFEALDQRDILLHHPYESFLPIVEFLRQAARDPQVLAIKQTLYRTSADSPLVEALTEAARNGKEVTVVVELRARFDEAANIAMANRLHQAGAHVLYGVVGYKTHAKMLMVVRREGRRLKRYVHLGTGNYHSKTARLYTDYGLLSADRKLGEDVHRIFLQLTSLGKITRTSQLLQAPFTLHKAMLEKIAREARHAAEGGKGYLLIKVNSLVEPEVIRALYQAAAAGVEIDLIVRGICCLRPGLAGVSEHIRVRSVVGRFLEHSRVYYFANNGAPELYLSSADCMERNFFRRVEVAFPITDDSLRDRVMREMRLYLKDNVQAWTLNADGSYTPPSRPAKPFAAQQTLLKKLADTGN